MNSKPFTVDSFRKAKEAKRKITMLTAYDYSMAKLLDESGVDALLVGDSLGMVILGYENTLQVTVDDMIHHARAVARGTKNAMVIVDMPFLSYHISVEESIRNAGRLIQEGLGAAVKLEGGKNVVDKVQAIVKAQIPVMGHLGLTPQSVHMFGGFKVQGKAKERAKEIMEDALRLQEAGVFAIVLECIPELLAKLITEKLDIPTIGIGAGQYCDGQILVTQDMLGMYNEFMPKFVKQYADTRSIVISSVTNYIKEVRQGSFPEEEHVFTMNEAVLEELNL